MNKELKKLDAEIREAKGKLLELKTRALELSNDNIHQDELHLSATSSLKEVEN